MIPIVAPGTKLAASVAAGASTLVVENNSSTGLNLANTEDLKLFDISTLPTFLASDEEAATSVTVQSNTPPSTSQITLSASLANSFPVGAIVLNNETVTHLVENTDYLLDHENGRIRFLSGGSAVASNYYAINGEYKVGSATHVKLGEELPNMEFSVRLVHKSPKGRTIEYFAPRATVSPDNASLPFDPADWMGTEVRIQILASSDPAYEKMPFGEVKLGHINGVEPGNTPSSYTVGVFSLYLTPLDATIAADRGFTTSEFSMGNVRVGSIEAPQEFLDHFIGVPQVKDDYIRLKKEINITATIENMTSRNMALILDGRIEEGPDAGYVEFATLIQAPADLTVPTWVSIGKRDINHV